MVSIDDTTPPTNEKIEDVTRKVDDVKDAMHNNISKQLENTEKAEDVAKASDQLKEEAAVFQTNSVKLRKEMRCKNLKMTILLTAIIVGILLIIFVPLILKA